MAIPKWKQLWRKHVKPRTIRVQGITISTDPKIVTKAIQKALYRDKYEDHEQRLVKKAVLPGDKVLEIGAGIGLISLCCSRICGAEAVLSYEANPIAASALRHNFSLNGMTPNVRVRAMAKVAGPIGFYINDNIFSSSLIERERTALNQVEADAMSAVLSEFQPNVLVIDVEGAELDLLPEIIGSGVQKIIAELHPHIVGEEAINGLLGQLHQAGFTVRERSGKVVWLANSASA